MVFRTCKSPFYEGFLAGAAPERGDCNPYSARKARAAYKAWEAGWEEGCREWDPLERPGYEMEVKLAVVRRAEANGFRDLDPL